MDDITVEVEGTRLTIKKPGTGFWVVYQKQFGNPYLVLIASWVESSTTSAEVGAFRLAALQAATNKARELGWIA